MSAFADVELFNVGFLILKNKNKRYMKNIFISVLLALALCPSQMKAQQNPILPGFHADPEITYSNQTHRYYIYSTTDGTPGWGGYTYQCFSSADLKEWRDEGEVLNAKNGQIAWADGNLWAPAVQEVKVGKENTSIISITAPTPRLAAASR